MQRPLRIFILGLSLLALLSGCPLAGPRYDDDLRGTLYRYEAAVRWGDPTKPYGFLRPGTEVAVPPGLGNIRVTGYEAISPPTPMEDGRWQQTVSIQYLHRDRQQVKTLIDRQVWVRDADSGHWYRDNPVPAYR